MTLRNIALYFAAFFIAHTASAFTITCRDINGREAVLTQAPGLNNAAGFYLKTGEPTVIYDPAFIARFSPPMRDFTFFHECGHLALGHALRILNGEPYEMWMEDEADIFATMQMVRFGYPAYKIEEVHAEVRKFREDAQHRSGRHREIITRLGRCGGYLANWLAARP